MRDYWSTLLTVVSLIVIFFLVSASYKTYKESTNQLDVLKEEVNLLKNRTDTLKYNKQLTADQILEYNKVLTSLIPDSEDFFSIIYALETISKQTNFEIVSYTVNLPKTSPEKIPIIVEGRGDTAAFLNFLQNYEFTGGRLVTSEKIQFSGTSYTNTRVTLNFYNKKFAFNQTVIPQLTKQDIDQLETIKSKIRISYGQNSTDTEYETKSNPF